jgi:hypothetical protein
VILGQLLPPAAGEVELQTPRDRNAGRATAGELGLFRFDLAAAEAIRLLIRRGAEPVIETSWVGL